ncbi:tetratricopeptide repeat protein [Paracoccus sp. MC1862]|uniref:tetratricopeptide repeat protein n=2 Tax=unclassified Paracoccus (in: a-proteobacteria) TaxID=2688777 RepID=UPI001603C68D|nr:SEL1-like repeat protein [Paracoccus sp. MC1862]MBB1498553.1 SEL1-like repeat protein [Paracoccus sp. MC1862]QQO44192.1 SEL1-like repeat protein [Paracoccus sp. MC1862]
MTQALDLESRDPGRAAISYARAALRGSARAAYYLGQLHETGSGVAPNPDMARLWYAAAADLPRAQQRLQALATADAPGIPAPPVPVFQARPGNGGSEMIWRLPEGAAPVRFRVEIFGPVDQPLPVQETTVPGLILPFPVSAWRVTALGADGSESVPSALVRMIPAEE